MKRKILFFTLAVSFSFVFAQREVPQERMEQIYEEVKTPYKYGLAVAPADNQHKIDCPTVFRQGDKWLMTYVVYNGKKRYGWPWLRDMDSRKRQPARMAYFGAYPFLSGR